MNRVLQGRRQLLMEVQRLGSHRVYDIFYVFTIYVRDNAHISWIRNQYLIYLLHTFYEIQFNSILKSTAITVIAGW